MRQKRGSSGLDNASCTQMRGRSGSVRRLDFQVEENAFQNVHRNSEHYQDNLYHIPEHIVKSTIFNFSEFTSIWKCFPNYVQTRKPVKVFESANDGFNLQTLYSKAKQFLDDNNDGDGDLSDYHYCLILVHTTAESKFGAFISAFPYPDARNPFKGTSESFVFSLAPNGYRMYQAASETNRYYLECNANYISIGSGYDGPAIRIDGNLGKGSTNHCETFESPILAGNGEKHTDDAFEVYNMEMFIL